MKISYQRYGNSDCTSRAAPGGRPGFSLSEMLVVVALMSILTAVALPRWATSLQSQRLNQAASRIIADLNRAQEAAYNTSTAKVVTFTVDSSQYAISGVTALDHRTGSYVIALSDDPYQCRLVSAFGQTGTQALTFDGYGLPDKGGNIIISSGPKQKTIVVDIGTGSAVAQ
jgi:prepilin-type N-terminal cleavage/methylation domain-containing protein